MEKSKIGITVRTARARNKHIARLQERNRELAEALAEERILRKEAWRYYQKRLRSRLFGFVDLYCMAMIANKKPGKLS